MSADAGGASTTSDAIARMAIEAMRVREARSHLMIIRTCDG